MTADIAFHAHGCDMRIWCDDAEIARYLRRLFRHLAPPAGGPLRRAYRVTTSATVLADGAPLEQHLDLPPLRRLLRDIDDHLIATSPGVLVHAAAATAGGTALVLPGRTGSGKSTLVAALVRAGCGYLTDELVSADAGTGDIAPYPRWISIDAASWDALADLEPTVPDRVAPLLAGQWQVDPADIRPGSVAGPTRPGRVIFPTFTPAAPTILEPMARTDALLALVDCTFHFHRHGAAALHALAALVEHSECHTLLYGDVEHGCTAILSLGKGRA